MKTFYAFLVVAVLGLAFMSVSAPVALADGADPILQTKGCGGTTGTPCDAEILGPGQTNVTVTETFTCDISGNCTATDSVINETGMDLSSFSLTLLNTAFTYSCGPTQLFACSPSGPQQGPATFFFSGATLCSDADDYSTGTFKPDGDECGVTITLTGTTSEGIQTGTSITGTFASAPEPSSALLLFCGLMAGLVGLKAVRNFSV